MILGGESRDVARRVRAVTISLCSARGVGQEDEGQPAQFRKVEFHTALKEELFPP